MTKRQKWTISLAAALVLAAGAATLMYNRHEDKRATGAATTADMGVTDRVRPTDEAIATAIRNANVGIDRLSVRTAGDIVILRGNADTATAEAAVAVARNLGATRVANLIAPATPFNDDAIRRDAERQLSMNRSLDGAKIRVTCSEGVLRVDGTVQHELQIDVARSIARSVRGTRQVQVGLVRG
jgi:osmotically-inducible protein OsmY